MPEEELPPGRSKTVHATRALPFTPEVVIATLLAAFKAVPESARDPREKIVSATTTSIVTTGTAYIEDQQGITYSTVTAYPVGRGSMLVAEVYSVFEDSISAQDLEEFNDMFEANREKMLDGIVETVMALAPLPADREI